jgi:hypothetical protein
MLRSRFGSSVKAVAISALLLASLPGLAAEKTRVRWHVVGTISGLAQPYTTAAYFPRPLSAGELVDMTFTIDTSVAGSSFGGYASYPHAIASAHVTGSDWSIRMKAPLLIGDISLANDHPDYGDALFMNAGTTSSPGQTWFNVQLDLRNPGGPNPGVGPWQPFTSLALPKKPPALGFFPGAIFYIQARRDVAGQPLDGAAYFGQILSITQERCD